MLQYQITTPAILMFLKSPKIKQFLANISILNSTLKKTENKRFFGVLRGYKMQKLDINWLIPFQLIGIIFSKLRKPFFMQSILNENNFKWNNLTKRKNCNTASITFKLYGYVILVCDENCIHKKGITVKCVNIQARGGFIQTNGKIS